MPAGVKLDLGASAKAWAADRAAAAAAREVGCGVLVSLGGDIATAGGAPPAGGRSRVTDDHRSDRAAPGQTIAIRSGGLATSSTAVRRWSHGGHTMHHIIDPDTGAPVRETWRTVSVAAATLRGRQHRRRPRRSYGGARLRAWLDELGLPARLIDAAGRIETVAGWPAEDDAGALAA